MTTKRGTRLFAVAASAIAVLTAIPATSWLVRAQFKLLTLGSGESAREQFLINGAAKAQAVPAPPDSYPLRLANALSSAPPNPDAPDSGPNRPPIWDKRVLALLPLRQRFGDHPALHAHILRYLTMGDLKIGRDAEENLLSKYAPSPSDAPKVRVQSTPETLQLAETAAERGEILDPQNAYFSQMRALVLLAQHRDGEAYAALHAAAGKPEWRDYVADEVNAYWAQAEQRSGELGTVSRTATAAAILFPHLARLRGEARVFAALAMKREIAGDQDGGFAIRHDLARVGAKMRAHASTVIGSLVGVAITSIASARPNGAPVLTNHEFPDKMIAAAGQARYLTYLSKIGHDDEAAWFVAEQREAERMKAIESSAMDLGLWGMRSFLWLIGLWGGGIFLLVNALWVLALGGASTLLARTPHVRAGLPVHRGIRFGLLYTIVLPILWTAFAFLNSADSLQGSDTNAAYTAVGILVLAAAPLWFMKRGASWREFGKIAAICAATIGVCWGIIGLGSLFLSGSGTMFRALRLLQGVSDSGEGNGDNTTPTLAATLIWASGALLVPLTMIIRAAITSRKNKIPFSVGAVRYFSKAAVPVTGILFALYVGVTATTLVVEHRLTEELRQTATFEGKYLAGIVGQEWPGEVEEKPAGWKRQAPVPPSSAQPAVSEALPMGPPPS